MATGYVELAIAGPRGWIVGFIGGFLEARGKGERLLDAEQEGFDCAPLRERLSELISPSLQTYHLLVPKDLREDVREAVERATKADPRVSSIHEQELKGARFSFSFTVYSKKHAQRLRRHFDELPEGVELSADASFTESVDPSAKGVEAYAPAHDYELTARGEVEGPVDGIVRLLRICKTEELIRCGKVEILRD